MPIPRLIDDVLHEASGRAERRNAVTAPSGGPAGNALLIAWTGLLLLVLIAAELITLLDVRGLIDWHVGIGVLLIPVALLKTAATGWRILRYYTGHQPYRTAGPPPTLLRVLGPLVIASTLGLLASGIVLIVVGEERSRQNLFTALGQRVDLITVHQALFFAFAALAGLHLLARIAPALALTSGRAPGRLGSTTAVAGSGRRTLALSATVVAAVIAVVLLLPLADDWQDDGGGPGGPPPGSSSPP
ncbi:hypothetical protein [Modestobacter excelsi]|uniref:hypothetical protein n=1 Tax=Modestobacter excelsi TaxID=2213161 RepID=UPI00110CE4B9|nr:hypothetical protein [Modestobacter excelsi]